MVKTIDYVLISSNLVNAVISHGVFGVEDYFDTDYQVVSVLVGLGGLLDAKFKDDTATNSAMFHDKFLAAKMHLDLDVMWAVFCKVLYLSAEAVFKKKWFKDYNHVFVRKSSKFHKLELLVLDSVNVSVVKSLFLSGSSFNAIWLVLSKVRKSYCSSKMLEAVNIKESRIRLAIDKRIENFELNKSHTIKSVLEHLFCKVTLDHLVMNNELVLEPDLVRTKVDPLKYVFDEVFSGMMCSIDFDEMSDVISNLPDEKAAGLSSISNEL
ncbi:hypothetical protein G9A89_008264 [Geosiphon pyriformis]|nr:hypothetical protein G9A89_008264 [Geosiphon pyriformis]